MSYEDTIIDELNGRFYEFVDSTGDILDVLKQSIKTTGEKIRDLSEVMVNNQN